MTLNTSQLKQKEQILVQSIFSKKTTRLLLYQSGGFGQIL